MASMPYFGIVLAYSVDAGGNYTNVSGLRTLTPPSGDSVEMGDDTTISSTSMIREKFKGWEDPGQLGFTSTWTGASYTALLAVKRVAPTATKPQWKITFPLLSGEANAATYVQQGFLTSLSLAEGGTNSPDPMVLTGTIELSGSPTFTEAN